MNYFALHLIVAVSWMIFLLQFIKSAQNNDVGKYIFGFLSLFFMVIVLFFGVKLMLLNPSVAKSGGWLHVKLSFAVLLILENTVLLYFVLRKKHLSAKCLEICYWLSYIAFMFMIYLTMYRPF